MTLTWKKLILQRPFDEFLFIYKNNFIKNFLIGHNNGKQYFAEAYYNGQNY